MRITEKQVDESHINEIVELIMNHDGLINIDEDDVKFVLAGREGMLYQVTKEEDMENGPFMRDFFNELKKKETVLNCTRILVSIGVPPCDSLSMEDVEVIRNFFASIDNENLEIKWGLKSIKECDRFSLLTVCTKYKNNQ